MGGKRKKHIPKSKPKKNLLETYKLVKGSIVGFAPAYYPSGSSPSFPEIFGTGFVVREDGIVATNNHVVEWIRDSVLPNAPPPPPGRTPCTAIMGKIIRDEWVYANLQVWSCVVCEVFVPGDVYYGPEKPDIGFVQVKANNLPVLKLDDSTFVEEGLEIAAAGYPLGTTLLTAPGYLHQITPTLRRGIISAVLPFPSPHPHAYMIDIMSQGGASGSPVFLTETGRVIGMLYGGFEDVLQTSEEASHKHTAHIPTNISYIVPSRLIAQMLENDELKSLALPGDAESLDTILERQANSLSVTSPRLC